MPETIEILSYSTSPKAFIELMQDKVSDFVTALPGQEYSFRMIAPEFMQFNQGGACAESDIALEVAFQQQKGPLKKESFQELDVTGTLIPALQDLIANAINAEFAQAVTEQVLKDLERLDGPFCFQETVAGSIVLGFKQTLVVFIRHASIVTH